MLGSVIIEYRDQVTKEKILPNDVYKNLMWGLHRYNSKRIQEYTAIKSSSVLIFISLFKLNYAITFYYKKDAIIPPIIKGSVEIDYIDVDSNKYLISSEKYTDLNLGDYIYNCKSIEKYELISDDRIKITLTEKEPNQTIVFKYKKIVILEDAYMIELNEYDIKNDGTSPVETSKGINTALQFLKGKKKYKKVIFPKGTYLIDENNPIIIDISNIIIDLNESILQINTNGLLKNTIIKVVHGAEGFILTNGTLKGDKYIHDYITNSGTHEWCYGINFEGGDHGELNNITITDTVGYGVNFESGNRENRFDNIDYKNLVNGKILNDGQLTFNKESVRTVNPYNILKCDGEFELGYTTGYQGYPYLKNREYISYFYDENMKYIGKLDCLQYRKVKILEGSKYVHFVFSQSTIPSNINCAWISNFKPATNITIRQCKIIDNRTLGIAFCGGQKCIVEDCLFSNNIGNNPEYAINFEDGWELMQDITIRNNKFINSRGSIVVMAGDNIRIEGNEIDGLVAFYGRVTNYKILNNIFRNSGVNLKYSSNLELRGNVYNQGYIWVEFERKFYDDAKLLVAGEKYINIAPSSINVEEITDSTIIWDSDKIVNLLGTYRRCNISLINGYMVNTKCYDCTIENVDATFQKDIIFENCSINNSSFDTYANVNTITIKNCKIINTKFRNSYVWNKLVDINILDCIVEINSRKDPLLEIALSRLNNLIFSGNRIISNIDISIINMYNTNYSVPIAGIKIQNNSITQSLANYVISGNIIDRGITSITTYNNVIDGGELLNPIYLDNMYVDILEA